MLEGFLLLYRFSIEGGSIYWDLICLWLLESLFLFFRSSIDGGVTYWVYLILICFPRFRVFFGRVKALAGGTLYLYLLIRGTFFGLSLHLVLQLLPSFLQDKILDVNVIGFAVCSRAVFLYQRFYNFYKSGFTLFFKISLEIWYDFENFFRLFLKGW